MIVKFEGKEYPFNGYVYPLNSINELVNDAYNKGKTDAIDECVNYVDEWDSVIAESLSKHMREQK